MPHLAGPNRLIYLLLKEDDFPSSVINKNCLSYFVCPRETYTILERFQKGKTKNDQNLQISTYFLLESGRYLPETQIML